MDLVNQLGLPVIMALLAGYGIKKWIPNTIINNKFIPIANFILQFLGQLLIAVKPAEAGVFNGAFAQTLAQIAVQAGLVTLLATGSHSTAKNTWQYFRQRALEAAQAKAAEALEKAAAPKGGV